MKIAVSTDERTDLVETLLKELNERHHTVEYIGPEAGEDADWPEVTCRAAELVASGAADEGIVMCWTGTGASIAANKVKGIRACLCHDTYSARQGVEHDDMNVVCLGARIIGVDLAKDILTAFIDANFLPEARFQRRLDKVLDVEKNQSAV